MASLLKYMNKPSALIVCLQQLVIEFSVWIVLWQQNEHCAVQYFYTTLFLDLVVGFTTIHNKYAQWIVDKFLLGFLFFELTSGSIAMIEL